MMVCLTKEARTESDQLLIMNETTFLRSCAVLFLYVFVVAAAAIVCVYLSAFSACVSVFVRVYVRCLV